MKLERDSRIESFLTFHGYENFELKEMDLDEIQDQLANVRGGKVHSVANLKRISNAIEDGVSLPPLIAAKNGGVPVLADGHGRKIEYKSHAIRKAAVYLLGELSETDILRISALANFELNGEDVLDDESRHALAMVALRGGMSVEEAARRYYLTAETLRTTQKQQRVIDVLREENIIPNKKITRQHYGILHKVINIPRALSVITEIVQAHGITPEQTRNLVDKVNRDPENWVSTIREEEKNITSVEPLVRGRGGNSSTDYVNFVYKRAKDIEARLSNPDFQRKMKAVHSSTRRKVIRTMDDVGKLLSKTAREARKW